jgi:CheY-like chemotaxis protein
VVPKGPGWVSEGSLPLERPGRLRVLFKYIERTAPNKIMTADSPIYVLVVEDDLFGRLHAIDLVERAGFKAVEATSAEEAIEILETRKDIRIVFTDIDMPGSMDGLKLAQAIRKRWPPIELILASGHFHPPESEIPARGRFFPKPYLDEEIISALNHFALRRPEASPET